jgi:hypothetical protein
LKKSDITKLQAPRYIPFMKYPVTALLLFLFSLRLFAQQAPAGRDTLSRDTLQSLELQLMGLSREFINSDDKRTRVSSTYHVLLRSGGLTTTPSIL